MEHFDPTPDSKTQPQQPKLEISEDAHYFWPATGNWALFIGIVTLIGAGLVGILLASVIIFLINKTAYYPGEIDISLIILPYAILFVCLTGFGILLIWLSNNLRRAARSIHPQDVSKSINSARIYFVLTSIATILAVLIHIIWLMVVTGD